MWYFSVLQFPELELNTKIYGQVTVNLFIKLEYEKKNKNTEKKFYINNFLCRVILAILCNLYVFC